MSLVTWNRIEPDPRGQPVEEGAVPRMYDPLWLLGRQWQIGELAGSNGGSPISVALATASSPIRELRYGTTRVPLDRNGPPLESLVELEGGVRADLRLRARSGGYFVDLLAAAKLSSYGKAALREFPFAELAATDPLAPLVRLLRKRSPDGAQIEALSPDALAARLGVKAVHRDRFDEAADKWRHFYRPRAGIGATTWKPERMEYEFALAAPTAAGTVVLEANQYGGGRLDWDSFTARIEPGGAATPAAESQEILPSVVQFSGSAPRRFWQAQPAAIDFGAVQAGPGEIGRVVLVEFALLWANDWFVAPVDVETASLVSLASVVVKDTFGTETAIRPCHEVLPDDAFALYRLSGAELPGLLFVPPVLPASLEGPLVEEVAFVRDEGANVAWAIERIVPGEAGRAIQVTRNSPPEAAQPPGPHSSVMYQPSTPIEQGWFPLVPVRDASGAHRLDRAQLVLEDGPPPAPRGVVLAGTPSIFDEEVPREGLLVRRRWQLARAADGTFRAWLTREKHPAAGEVSSGLEFDHLQEVPGRTDNP